MYVYILHASFLCWTVFYFLHLWLLLQLITRAVEINGHPAEHWSRLDRNRCDCFCSQKTVLLGEETRHFLAPKFYFKPSFISHDIVNIARMIPYDDDDITQ